MEQIAEEVQRLAEKAHPVPTPSPTSNGGNSRVYDAWLGFDAYSDKLKIAKRKLADWYNDGFDRGQALVLAGGYGSGKTHLARVVLGACAPHTVWMLSEPDMLANIRATYSGNGSEGLVIGNYRRAPLLIIDDVGTGWVKDESAGWREDIYWRILDRRAELGLPMILTTNLSLYDLGKWIGGRALSRLQGMMGNREAGYVDLFGVEDYRARAWKEAA